MPPLSMLIKPASSSCNLSCKYCFYHSIAGNRSIKSYGTMDFDTLEIIVKKAFELAEGNCTFAFQGGEPTLAGLDFYRKLIELENKYNINNVSINNAIQTNGFIIDEEWAEFLSHNNFLVGLSLDGTKDIHDSSRVDNKGKGSYNNVMNTVKLFNKYNVEYNILTVVNSVVARHIGKIYDFFKTNEFKYLQFIPCLDPLNEQPGENWFSLRPQRYATFLKKLFHLWYQDITSGNIISIRNFENYVGILKGYAPEACGMTGTCQCQFVIEADGGVYPCDFYVMDEWYMGNIKEMDFYQLRQSPVVAEFIKVSEHIDPKCRDCKWINLCRGGCRRSREPFINEKPALNYYCSSYIDFFEYAADGLNNIARQLR